MTARTQKPAPKPKAQPKIAKAGPVTEPVETPAPVKGAAKAEKREQARGRRQRPAGRARAGRRAEGRQNHHDGRDSARRGREAVGRRASRIPMAGEGAHYSGLRQRRQRRDQYLRAGGNSGQGGRSPGVVAYAGSELKGYGNLVLIRHPNGFVTAYAHNGDITVKRGDQVTRGQTIAKSGQSGNVSSPQLHFELRKGSTPVDPTNYLAGL